MTDWSILIVGMLAVACAWDVGRRFVDKIVTRKLQTEFDTLKTSVDELSELREEVAEIGGYVKNIRTSLESQKAVATRRGNWPRVT